jgi:uncharacterized membrane protein
MNGLREFIKTTIVGGLLFLIPIVLLIFIVSEAMAMVNRIAGPIAGAFPGEEVLGVGVVTIVSAFLLLAFSFLAGLIAATRVGQLLKNWLEESLFGKVPQYRMIKSVAEGLTQLDNAKNIRTALVEREGVWQLGYVMDQIGAEVSAVFLPMSPTTLTGTLVYVSTERVRLLDVPVSEVVMLVQKLGLGSANTFKEGELGAAMRPA